MPFMGRVMLLSESLTAHVVIKAVLVSFTVTCRVSATGCVPSCAVRTRVKAVSSVTAGAIKVVEGAEVLANAMSGESGEVCDHVYVMESALGSMAGRLTRT